MFVLVDLARGAEVGTATAYYVWLDEQVNSICERIDTSSSPQSSYSIYVPQENTFHSGVDVSEYMNRHIRENRSARGFVDAIAGTSLLTRGDEVSASIDNLSSRVRLDGSSFVDPLLAESPFPWPNFPESSFVESLHSAHRALEQSHDTRAAELLERVSVLSPSATSHEQAEYQYLLGRVHVLQNQVALARRCFKTAIRLFPSEPKYTTAWLDELLRRFSGGPNRNRFIRLLHVLPDSSRHEVVALKAKLLAVLDRQDEALRVIPELPPARRHLQFALVFSLGQRWHDARSACSTGLGDPSLPERHQGLLYILKARATFNVLLELATGEPASSVTHIPLTGPTGLDMELLKDCWSDSVEALTHLQRIGWPLEVEYLADFLAIPAVVLDQQQTILASVKEAASIRPHIEALQSCLEYVAFACGDLKLALEAARRQQTDPATVTRQALLSFEIGENQTCLDIVLAELDRTSKSGTDVDPDILVVGAVAAHLLFDSSCETEFLGTLRKRPDSDPYFALHEYLVGYADAPLAREDALDVLMRVHDEHPTHGIIKGILFEKLDTHSHQSAQKLISIFDEISGRRNFALREILRLAEALATLGRWPKLLQLAEKEIYRFGPVDSLVTIKAFALESMGESATALSLLEGLVSKDKIAPFALMTYINIAVRCGFVSEALAQLTRLLQTADVHDRKELLRMLFGLRLAATPTDQALLDVAWRFGQLVNQNDEVEEGTFLNMHALSTASVHIVVTEERQREFARRVDVFSRQFPRSTVFRVVSLPAEGDPSAVFELLDEISGLGEDQKRWLKKTVHDLKYQRIPLPFAWRPRNVLMDVVDVFQLWEISKLSSRDDHQYHLTMFGNDGPQRKSLQDVPRPPLLDVLSLVIIADLDLFDVLFSVFPRVAVAKSTLIELQTSSALMSSHFFADRSKTILRELRLRLSAVIQPGAPEGRSNPTRWEQIEATDHLKGLLRDGEFVGYSDDIFIRVYYNVHDVQFTPICSYDVLLEAERRGLLSKREVADRLGRLAAWNVGGVPIHAEYFFSTLPPSIDATSSPDEALQTLIDSTSFCEISAALWDLRKPYRDVIHHIAAIIASLVAQETVVPTVTPAIWSHWLNKVRLRLDVTSPPLEHLAHSMTLAADQLIRNGAQLEVRTLRYPHGPPISLGNSIASRLWEAFLKVVALEHGSKMEELHERGAIARVGSTVARLSDGDFGFPRGREVLTFLASGFVQGTADYSIFMNAYQDARNERLSGGDADWS